MAKLSNWNHERFASLLAEKIIDGELVDAARQSAYREVGFAPSQPNARRLANRPEVRARVAELTNRAAELAEIDRAYVLIGFKRIADANIVDLLKGAAKQSETARRLLGDPAAFVRYLETLPRGLTDAIASLEFNEKSGSPKLKLHDKIAALTNIARAIDLFREGDSPDKALTLADLVSASYAAGRGKVIDGELAPPEATEAA
jgi:hypothetical protein